MSAKDINTKFLTPYMGADPITKSANHTAWKL